MMCNIITLSISILLSNLKEKNTMVVCILCYVLGIVAVVCSIVREFDGLPLLTGL